jgi:hypothetical protein
MKTHMANGAHEIEVLLPRRLLKQLAATAKAEKSSVSALILDAVKADVRSASPLSPNKKSPSKT